MEVRLQKERQRERQKGRDTVSKTMPMIPARWVGHRYTGKHELLFVKWTLNFEMGDKARILLYTNEVSQKPSNFNPFLHLYMLCKIICFNLPKISLTSTDCGDSEVLLWEETQSTHRKQPPSNLLTTKFTHLWADHVDPT